MTAILQTSFANSLKIFMGWNELHRSLFPRVRLTISRDFSGERIQKFVMQRPPSQLIRCWTWSVDFSNFGVNLTKWNGADVLFTTINLRVIEKNNHNRGMVMFRAFSATVSHWLGANLESALRYVLSGYRNHHFFISGVYHIPSAILVEINIKMPPLPCHDCQIFIIGFPI